MCVRMVFAQMGMQQLVSVCIYHVCTSRHCLSCVVDLVTASVDPGILLLFNQKPLAQVCS